MDIHISILRQLELEHDACLQAPEIVIECMLGY
jgi:hypothetical protein